MTEAKNIVSFRASPGSGKGRGPARPVDFPFNDYIAAWKIFRSFSNEDVRIAEHILRLMKVRYPGYQRGSRGLHLVDIGPGDGRVLLQILLRMSTRPSGLKYVEPDPQFMTQAKDNVHFYQFADRMEAIDRKVCDLAAEHLEGADVILCTHCAYFLTPHELDMLVLSLAPGATLYVLLDSEEGIFTRLWEVTNPKFYEIAAYNRRWIESFKRSGFTVLTSKLSTTVDDPSHLRADLGQMLVSLLCYDDERDLHAERCEEVRSIISNSIVAGKIECASVCYEIRRD